MVAWNQNGIGSLPDYFFAWQKVVWARDKGEDAPTRAAKSIGAGKYKKIYVNPPTSFH